ncbi:MAG: N-6 DNA methylase, partial [Campylobacter sp.]|nr:N-6 DNA methylase [Campylobacter sp.]
MITKDNLKEVLEILNFNSKDKIVYEKFYQNSDKISIKVDFDKKTIDYLPFDNRFKSDILPSIDNPSVGFMAHRETTLNFKDEKAKEVFVDLIAVDKLLEKGYKPEHIVLEPEFKTGHGDKAYGDILVLNENFENLLLIECKTTTSDINKSEFNKEWQNMLENGGQLISYQGVRKSKFLCLLSFDLEENQILTYNYIISMLDDENGKKAEKNYLNSSDKEAIFKVWKELYNQNYEEAGIFEPSMQAYNIGFEKPTIDILKPLVNRDIDEKRSKWDDELRAHSVNDRNLALAKLMNLFLCKITDELENPNDLQFYWYGDEADNAYKLIDRLQNLFKKGMEKYLNQKITYHSSKSIQNAFSDDFKGIEVQKKIEEIFKELKYFQNGDFNFIEVFNKELFEKNFEVLLPIVKSLQNVKFTQIEDANVLGHYFECFINDMPQHEGQYFTPMPLANFMIYSLPILKDIKMLDYACGVGHFITQFFNFHKDKKDSITALGVEKDTRLAKTSKIATFMNNVSAEIKAQNALKTGIVQNHNFSYLLCNPPYSVDEFLKVLDEKSRNDFELFNKDLNIATNSIECFFIEKASKVLETNALMAIIVPSSVLGKSGIYERTREILLRDFRIISICEFGSETFYKTGTNVNVIFAIRKAINNTTSINKAEIFSDFYKLIL